MRFAWLGVHADGIPALEALLAASAPVAGVLTLTPALAAKRSGAADYRPVCEKYGVPLHYIANVNDPAATDLLRSLDVDIVFVIGWHQVVRAEALATASIGMIGAHASLLPRYRGSAPINWALIRGERETGNTLVWLSEDLDTVAIADQVSFPITPYDTCATLYQQVAASNRDMLLRLVPRLLAGERPGRPQPPTDEPILPRRRPADGGIDWSWPATKVYDFVRALTRPYPGAFSGLDGRRWRIWQAAICPAPDVGETPGEIVCAMHSPVSDACGLTVQCGDGRIVLLEVESDDGTVLKGRQLSEQPWTGKRWTGQPANGNGKSNGNGNDRQGDDGHHRGH